jgi:hypothetical protein
MNIHSEPPYLATDPKQYYQHLPKDLPEFLKLRQLLLWCFERDTEHLKNDKGFRREESHIQRAVIDTLKNLHHNIETQQISTSWAGRPLQSVVMKPNPRNIEMQASYDIYQQHYERQVFHVRICIALKIILVSTD